MTITTLHVAVVTRIARHIPHISIRSTNQTISSASNFASRTDIIVRPEQEILP